jgi:hypothetical protein
LWVELIETSIFFGPQPQLPPGRCIIRYKDAFTPTDALLMLLGAEMWLCEPFEAWAIDNRRENRIRAGQAVGASCGTMQAAMYRIRRDMLDAYLRPARHIGGPLP